MLLSYLLTNQSALESHNFSRGIAGEDPCPEPQKAARIGTPGMELPLAGSPPKLLNLGDRCIHFHIQTALTVLG